MNINIKTIFPSMLCLFIGMLFFFSIRAVSIPMPPGLNKLIMGLIACVVIYLLCKPFLRYENISLSEVNLKPSKKTTIRLCIGLMIGAVITGAMLIALFTLTNLGIDRIQNISMASFMLASVTIVPLALMEELLFRGYPFFRLSQLINIRWVIMTTAILFAFYHYNGTSNIGSLLIGPGIWGVTFGVAAYLSKSIAVPLGIHISANVLQSLFGLKAGYVSMWEVTQSTGVSTIIEPDHLGYIMQTMLLFVSIIVLEFTIRKNKSIRLKVANTQSKLKTNTVLENK